MQFTVISLFPNEIEHYCRSSILGRAQNAGIINVNVVNPRDFTTDVHHKVDDAPYGGGAGMVLMCQPIWDAYQSISPLQANEKIVLTSPHGQPFTQEKAQEFSNLSRLVIICGHYEGIDARVETLIPNLELVSLGDFVLTGGELPALCIIDATTRLIPGALGKAISAEEESFMNGLLEYPQYTRPSVFEGHNVPEILLSGNHGEIARWRHKMSLWNTRRYRPDLLANRSLSILEQQLMAELDSEEQSFSNSILSNRLEG